MSNEGYERAYNLMEEIWENFGSEDKEWFLTTDTILMHSDLGMHLRNYAHLWEEKWEPYLINGVDYSANHPDAVSGRVLKNFQQNMLLRRGE
jgi:hypothetical protein